MNSLAKILKQNRENLNLTQNQIARKLNYKTSQFVSNWESGLSFPPIKDLRKVANLYKIDIEVLKELYILVACEKYKENLISKFKKI